MASCSMCGSDVVKHFACGGLGDGPWGVGSCGNCHGTGLVCSKDVDHNWRSGRRLPSQEDVRKAQEVKDREARQREERDRRDRESEQERLEDQRLAEIRRGQQHQSKSSGWRGFVIFVGLLVAFGLVAFIGALVTTLAGLALDLRDTSGELPAWLAVGLLTLVAVTVTIVAARFARGRNQWIRGVIGFLVGLLVALAVTSIYVMLTGDRANSAVTLAVGLAVLVVTAAAWLLGRRSIRQ